MQVQLQVNVDDIFFTYLKEQKDDFIKQMVFHHALMLYRKGKLSLEKAAELAGYERTPFMYKLQTEGEFISDSELDLSPLLITSIEQHSLQFKEPLILTSVLDDSQQYLCVADEAIGLDVFAINRPLLIDEVQEQLAMLWSEYACCNDSELDNSALKIKHNLLARIGVN